MGGPGRITWALNGHTVRDNVVAETSPPPASLYLQKREQRSVGHTPWTTITLGLLLPMLKQNRQWALPGQRLGLLRLIWDYLPHGRNKVKGIQTTPEPDLFSHQLYWDSLPRCKLGCNSPDDRHHLLMECQNTNMLQARQSGFAILQQKIKNLESRPLKQYWQLIFNTLHSIDPTRLSSSIMIGCPFLCHLNSWDASMVTCFSQPELDKFKKTSAPLFTHLFNLSRTLWYTYCQEAHPKQLDNHIANTDMQQVLHFSQSSCETSTQASYKAFFKDHNGVPLDTPIHSPLDHSNFSISPTHLSDEAELGPHDIERQCEDWNNIK